MDIHCRFHLLEARQLHELNQHAQDLVRVDGVPRYPECIASECSRMVAIAPQLNPLASLATVAISAAEGEETAASVDTRGVGELFQAVGTLSKRLAVRAVRKATAIYFHILSVLHALLVSCNLRIFFTGVRNLLVVLVVLGHDAGGQGSDEDGEVLHFEFKRNSMSAQQNLRTRTEILLSMREWKWMVIYSKLLQLTWGTTLALYTTNIKHSTPM